MTTEQKELLRDTLIDYLTILTSEASLYNIAGGDIKIARIRLLLKEVV